MKRHSAFTLLELLLAVTLLSVVTVAVFGWITSTARTSARFMDAARDEASVQVVRAHVSDDLSVAVFIEDRTSARIVRGELVLRTLNHAASDPPGTIVVTWRFDPGTH